MSTTSSASNEVKIQWVHLHLLLRRSKTIAIKWILTCQLDRGSEHIFTLKIFIIVDVLIKA